MKRRTMLVLGVASAAACTAAFAAAPASTTTATRLTASIASKPGVSGVFVASLTGKTLSWRLLVHGLGAPLSAQLRTGRQGPIAATLCRNCSVSAHRTTVVGAAASAALAAGTAYIDVHPAKAAKPRVLARIALGVPTLELVGVADGQTIALPFSFAYRISSFQVGAAPLGSLEVAAADGGARAMLDVGAQSGSTTIPDDKRWLLGGPRDIRFSLVTADGSRVPNAEASVTLHGVTIAGRR